MSWTIEKTDQKTGFIFKIDIECEFMCDVLDSQISTHKTNHDEYYKLSTLLKTLVKNAREIDKKLKQMESEVGRDYNDTKWYKNNKLK